MPSEKQRYNSVAMQQHRAERDHVPNAHDALRRRQHTEKEATGARHRNEHAQLQRDHEAERASYTKSQVRKFEWHRMSPADVDEQRATSRAMEKQQKSAVESMDKRHRHEKETERERHRTERDRLQGGR
jgi:hypothetical protein